MHLFGRLREILLRLCVVLLAIAYAAPANASDPALSDAYLLPELFEIMAEEGLASFSSPASTMLDPRQHQRWIEQISDVYDPRAMHDAFMDALSGELQRDTAVREAALDFALSELGAKVLQLEISARRALLDDTVDLAAKALLEDARATQDDAGLGQRLADVRERVEINDLVDLNVSLGLNTSYAYFMGMQGADTLRDMSDTGILELVAEQEAEIRKEVTDWIEAYFLMAYSPLSRAEMRDYIKFAGSPEGIAFNRAMFVAFDTVYVPLSRRVGAMLGQAMRTEDL